MGHSTQSSVTLWNRTVQLAARATVLALTALTAPACVTIHQYDHAAPGGAVRRGVRIDPGILAQVSGRQVAPLADGIPRPVAAIRAPGSGRVSAFVENELLITAKNQSAIEALADRYGGDIVRAIEPPIGTDRGTTYVVRLDPAWAPAVEFGAAEDGVTVSSERARRLLAIATHERRNGVPVGLNLVGEPTDFLHLSTTEQNGQDAAKWDYMRVGGPLDVNVAGAWRALALAGRLSNKIPIGIVDGGFAGFSPAFPFLESDLPDGIVAVNAGGPNAHGCNGSCLWHGTNAAEAAAGVADDNEGSAGPAGPVAQLILVDIGSYSIDSFVWGLRRAANEGARIINMSFRGLEPRDTGWFSSAWSGGLESFEDDTIAISNSGRLLFAAAGNDGMNVDVVNDDGDEETWVYPCENEGVICVGGWRNDGSATAGQDPDPSSNFSTGGGEVVDIWGPYTLFVGDDPENMGFDDAFHAVNGTSFASPFVAGVAALVWAGNPSLSSFQVWDLLNKHAKVGGPLVRRVNAYASVREAILSAGGNIAPFVEIVSPQPSAKLSQASPTTLSAAIYDIEDEAAACCDVAWTVDAVPVGNGNGVSHPFAGQSLGEKTIAVQVTDSGGASVSVTVTATLQNAGPIVNMVTVPPSPLVLGLPHPFIAQVLDDTSTLALPIPEACPQVSWTSDQASDPKPLATGCFVQIAFASPGPRTVEAFYIDSYGQKGSVLAPVNVDALAAGALAVAIQSPHNDAHLFAEEAIVVEYQINDPAPPSPPSYTETWMLTRKGTSDTRPIAMQKVGGKLQFKFGEVFPEFQFSNSNVTYILTLVVQSSSGAKSGPAAIGLTQMGLIH
jgi:serine protease